MPRILGARLAAGAPLGLGIVKPPRAPEAAGAWVGAAAGAEAEAAAELVGAAEGTAGTAAEGATADGATEGTAGAAADETPAAGAEGTMAEGAAGAPDADGFAEVTKPEAGADAVATGMLDAPAVTVM